VALTTFLFDLDGTLIDSIELILRSYRHTMRLHRGHEPSDDVWMQGLGTRCGCSSATSPRTRRDRGHGGDVPRVQPRHHDELVRPMPAWSRRCWRCGTREDLGLVTSKMRSGAVRGLRVAGLEDAFQVIVGADEVTHPKPHPEPVLTALERLGAPATGAVFVGDSRHDLECGRAAG